MSLKFALVALALATAASSPAMADDNSSPQANQPDPNRMVCERQETPGTRLGSRRVCKTAAEWEAERAAQRQGLERNQNQRWKSE